MKAVTDGFLCYLGDIPGEVYFMMAYMCSQVPFLF